MRTGPPVDVLELSYANYRPTEPRVQESWDKKIIFGYYANILCKLYYVNSANQKRDASHCGAPLSRLFMLFLTHISEKFGTFWADYARLHFV